MAAKIEINKLSTAKKALFVIFILSLASIVYLFLKTNKNTSQLIPNFGSVSTGPTPTPSDESLFINYNTITSSLKVVDKSKNATGIFYDGSNIYYLSNSSIYSIKNVDTPIISLTGQLSAINYPYNPYLFLKSSDQLNFVNPVSGTNTQKFIFPNNYISPDTKNTAIATDKNLKIDGLISKNYTLNFSITHISWSPSGTKILAWDKNNYALIDLIQDKISENTASSSIKQLEFSPNNQMFCLLSGTQFQVLNVSDQKEIYAYNNPINYVDGSFTWSTTNKIFYIEKYYQKVDYVFFIDPTKKTKSLTVMSYPIPSRINTLIHPISDKDESVYFIDNVGHVWYIKTKLTKEELNSYSKEMD